MIARASSTAPTQSCAQAGFAHSVMTEENPASLPPTWTLTYPVPPSSMPSCADRTPATTAPEQAWNDSGAPSRAAWSTGYACGERRQSADSSRYSRVPTPEA